MPGNHNSAHLSRQKYDFTFEASDNFISVGALRNLPCDRTQFSLNLQDVAQGAARKQTSYNYNTCG